MRGLLAVRESCEMQFTQSARRARVHKTQPQAEPLGLCLLVPYRPLANAREKRVSLATERRLVRGEGPLGEDGYSSASRLVLGARAAGRYASHTGLESASPPIPERLLGSFPGPLADHLESNL